MNAILDRTDVWYLTPLTHNMNPMLCINVTWVRNEPMPGVEAYLQVGTSRIRGGDVVGRGWFFNLRLMPVSNGTTVILVVR